MFDIGFIFSNGWCATEEHYWVFWGAMMAFVGFQVPLGVLNTLVPFDEDNGLGDLVGLFITCREVHESTDIFPVQFVHLDSEIVEDGEAVEVLNRVDVSAGTVNSGSCFGCC
ncbi:MAG: hypothetical protein ACON5D_15975 [Rubripirellula sp.]